MRLTGPLPWEDGAATFRFPLVVAPRYVPGVPLPGPHVGISGNLNRAIGQASSEYVALLDSDDWALPNRLERQLEVLEARPEVGVVGARMTEIDLKVAETTAGLVGRQMEQ